MAKNKADDKIFERLKKRFTECSGAINDVRVEARDDIRFCSLDEQWEPELLKKRKNRPNLVINKVKLAAQQICNEHRQNPVRLKFRPFDSASDPDKAELVNGLVRHILNNTNSQQAMDNAFDHAVCGSFGFFRVITEHVNDHSFDQTILVKQIKDPLSVYFPLHLITEPDFSDAKYAFIQSTISLEEFEERWPKVDVSSFSNTGEGNVTWKTEDTVNIVEYFEVQEEPKTIYLVSDGTNKQVVDDIENLPESIELLDQRETKTRKIMWYKACGGCILDSREWAGKYIPIIPILGKEINLDGEIHLLSLTRGAKDAQRMLNYWKSLQVELVALQPRVPFIGAAGQFEGHPEWDDANEKSYSRLEYNPTALGGILAPPPQRVTGIGIDAGIINAMQASVDDVKATTSVYDASLGARGNETSGKAINARKREGYVASYHYQDSAILATTYLGKILLDLIGKIFDTARIIRILGDDMQEKTAQITDGYFEDIDTYDIVADVGPDYATKRTEIVETLTMLNQSSPMFSELNGDYLANNLDIDGARELANRMRKFINMKYPGLIEEKGVQGQGDGMSEQEVQEIIKDLQSLQQQLQAKTLESQQMDQVIQKMQAELDNKEADRQNKIDVAQINAAAGIDKAKITTHPKDVENVMKTVEHLHGRDREDIEDARYTEPERTSET
jgi:hypothetical protein